MTRTFLARNPSVLIFLAVLALFTLAVTLLSEGLRHRRHLDLLRQDAGQDAVPVPCRLAMDLVWGYAGILASGTWPSSRWAAT
jgi:urea transport system permease protein